MKAILADRDDVLDLVHCDALEIDRVAGCEIHFLFDTLEGEADFFYLADSVELDLARAICPEVTD